MALEAYIIHLLILIGIFSILTISLNLAMGYAGLLNIGHIAFYGVGAYTSALLAVNLEMSFWPSLVIAGLIAAIFGLILSIPTWKLRGDYLALATLGFAIIIESVFKNWVSLTRGPLGISGIPKPTLFGFAFSSLASYLLLVIVFVLITYFIIQRLGKSPFGSVLKAIREDETIAKALGKNTFKYKTMALVVSAFFAGIAGALYAHYITFIDPTSFSVLESILIISMLIVGGLANNLGAILGAATLILLPEPLRFLGLPSSMVGALRQIIYALLLVYLVVKRPRGILGEFRKETT